MKIGENKLGLSCAKLKLRISIIVPDCRLYDGAQLSVLLFDMAKVGMSWLVKFSGLVWCNMVWHGLPYIICQHFKFP